MPEIIFGADGEIRHVYNEEIEEFSKEIAPNRTTTRASHVEPTAELSERAVEWLVNNTDFTKDTLPDMWWADMLISGGPVLGPFDSRAQALEDEVTWLKKHNIPICRKCSETPEQ